MAGKQKKTTIWARPSTMNEFRKLILNHYPSPYGQTENMLLALIENWKLTHSNTHTQNSRKIGKIEDKRVVSLIAELWNFCDLHGKTTISARELNAKITKCAGKDPRTHKSYIDALIDLRFISHHKEIAAHFEIKKDYIKHKLKEIEG